MKVSCPLFCPVLAYDHTCLAPASIGDDDCYPVVQDDLNTAKVAVAVKAAGLDADLQWLRRNLAQVIWYGLLLPLPLHLGY